MNRIEKEIEKWFQLLEQSFHPLQRDERCKAVSVSSMEDVLKLVECPICMEVEAGVRIFQCKKGHHLCGNCKRNIDNCPTCREPITNSRNFGLEAISDTLIFSCKNLKCGETFKGSELNQHMKVCEHRPFACFESSGSLIPKCDGTLIKIDDFKEHFFKLHKPHKQAGFFQWIDIGFNSFDSNYMRWHLSYLIFDSKMFLSSKIMRNGVLFIWLTLVGTETEAKQYKYSITFRRKNDPTTFLQWNLRLHSHHYNTLEDILKTGDCVCALNKQVKTLCADNGKYKYACDLKYDITKENNDFLVI